MKVTNRGAQIFARRDQHAQLRAVKRMAVGMGLLLLAMPFLLLGIGRLHRWDVVDWLQLAIGLAFCPLMLVQIEAVASMRLTIDDRGMRIDGRCPQWFRRLASRMYWSVDWPEIRTVELMKAFGIARLTVAGRAVPVAVQLWGWVPESEAARPSPKPGFWPLLRPSGNTEESPVWRALQARGIVERKHVGTTAVDFDLFAHATSRRALATMALLGGVGLIATVVERETYIADGYGFLAPHAGITMLGALAFWLALRRAEPRLPRGIAEGVAAVALFAVGIFSYGSVLLVNRAVVSAEPVVYRVGNPCTTLEPADPALPRIIWRSGFQDYWCQFKRGTELTIPVRRGVFGTWQFDQRTYTDKIWAWRDEKKQK